MNAEIDPTLTQGGDCFLHYHSIDRVPDQVFLSALEGVYARRTVTGNTTLTATDDIVLVDTTSGNISVTLPRASNGKEFQVVKTAAAFTLTILPTGADTILGTTSLAVTGRWTSLHFKSVVGGYILI